MSILKKIAALSLVLVISLSACNAKSLESEADRLDGVMTLTDWETSSTPLPYAAERPEIDDSPILPEPQAVAVQSAQDGASLLAATSPGQNVTKITGEVRGIWISYLDIAPILTGKTEQQFTASIKVMYDNVKNYGLNALYVHVRPFADALYRSDYFPWSYLATGTEGKDPGYDPLEIMVREARARGLRIEAWLNPYRVRAAGGDKSLSSSNQAKKWLDSGDKAVIQYEGVISYNPASEKARNLIVNGAVEIIRNYAVDGIHIDDYFYPHTADAFDKASYTAYKNGGGSLALADWRRANVETLVKMMYTAVKKENSNATFGISPQSSVSNNYNAQYLDVKKIVSEKGYCDYICPQIYFGFENGTQPFAKTLDEWDAMIKTSAIDLYVGLGAYKCGLKDSWAGKGAGEWTENKNLLNQMVAYSRDAARYKGFAIYRYDSIFNPAKEVSGHIKAEADSLKKLF